MAEQEIKYPTPKEKLALAEKVFVLLGKGGAGEEVDAYDVLTIVAQLISPGRQVQLTRSDRYRG